MTSPVVASAIEHWDALLGEDESLQVGIVTKTDDPVRVSSLELDREYYARHGIDGVEADPRLRRPWRPPRLGGERGVVADAITEALNTDYIAQHRVELRREEYPTREAPGARRLYYEDTDPFLFRGRLGGLLTRLSPGELTNVHAEGSVVASFAIEPR
jgi:hypothetical protein